MQLQHALQMTLLPIPRPPLRGPASGQVNTLRAILVNFIITSSQVKDINFDPNKLKAVTETSSVTVAQAECNNLSCDNAAAAMAMSDSVSKVTFMI